MRRISNESEHQSRKNNGMIHETPIRGHLHLIFHHGRQLLLLSMLLSASLVLQLPDSNKMETNTERAAPQTSLNTRAGRTME
jgi:hypothetical protein